MEDTKEQINITEEQEKITEKINRINESGVFGKMQDSLTMFVADLRKAGIRSPNLAGRVKKADSAREKISRQNMPASGIYDLIGYMLIVGSPEEYQLAQQALRDRMPADSFVHDFDGSLPENHGYSSFHMGVKARDLLDQEQQAMFPEELRGTSVEVQLKSMGMYIAQESTHDSIYKNPNYSKEQKDQLQTVMFPLIERIVNIQKYQEQLEITFDPEERQVLQGRVAREQQAISALKQNSRGFIEQNMSSVEDILKEFIAVQYIEQAKNDPFLNLKGPELKELKGQVRDDIDALVAAKGRSQMQEQGITGFSSIDAVYEQIMASTPEQIAELHKQISEQAKETDEPQVASVAEFAKLDKEVTPEDRRKGIIDITKALQTRDVQKDTKQNDDIEISA